MVIIRYLFVDFVTISPVSSSRFRQVLKDCTEMPVVSLNDIRDVTSCPLWMVTPRQRLSS